MENGCVGVRNQGKYKDMTDLFTAKQWEKQGKRINYTKKIRKGDRRIMDKKTYIGIVKFTLQSMVELARTDKGYNLTADTIHYYETTIRPEMQITQDEFLELCREVEIEK